MNFGLRGRNAVVFGGTRGIGCAIANTLAVEGADVAVYARNADQVKNAVAELQKPRRADNQSCVLFAAVHESPYGTSRHLVRCSGMPAVGGRPEVTGRPSKRRF
jgi:NAD(P)-dependent dehydrogenase (short-subunit alcohol dehydrogenase family)